MSALQGLLGALALPPVLFLALAAVAGALAWRGFRRAGLLAMAASLASLLLATPFAAGLLFLSLERGLDGPTSGEPRAIIILGGDMAHGRNGIEVGPLTLERLRAGAALHRSTGLPILVTGGVLRTGQPALADLMAGSLQDDFRVPVRWVERAASDTRQNVSYSAAMLRADGTDAAWVVSQGWHLARALDAFSRVGFEAHPAPVRLEPLTPFEATDLLPRADHLGESWYAIREWVGRAFYRLRDGGARIAGATPAVLL